MSHHPLFPPSGAHRWMRCTGSIDIVRALPDETSEFAKEGVAAHHAFAHILTYGHLDLGTPLPEGYTYTREMRDALMPAVQRAMGLINAAPHNVEQSVNFKVDKDTIYGTADLLVLDGNTLRVVDLKYGQGVRVNAQDNYQLMLYALGAIESFSWWGKFTRVELHILQPRLDHYDNHVMKPSQLWGWSGQVQSAVRAYRNGIKTFVPGNEQCRWCPHAGNCVAANQHVVSLFEDLGPEQVSTLPKADLVELLNQLSLIEQTIKAVREKATAELLSGGDIPGWKLVAGRTQRRWKSADDVTAVLIELDVDAYKPREVRSVADVEKELPKHVFQNKLQKLVTKPEGRPTLAKQSDKRPAINAVDLDAFEDLTEESK